MAIAGDSHVRLLWRRLLIAVLAGLCVVAALAAWRVWRKERESAALRQEAQAQLADLESRHGKLSADVAELETQAGKEKAWRGQYDVGRAGERLIVIVEPPAPPPQPTSTPWYERLRFW